MLLEHVPCILMFCRALGPKSSLGRKHTANDPDEGSSGHAWEQCSGYIGDCSIKEEVT